MTKAQRADALLWAAKWWQNERPRPGARTSKASSFSEVAWDVSTDDIPWPKSLWLNSASTALTEVGALGFRIEGAEVWDRKRKIWREQ